MKTYQEISNVVRADIERVKNILDIKFDLNSNLSKELSKYLNGSSKMIRTLVTVLYLRASKIYLLPEHYELFALSEIIHNASLIHDDVIDESKLRRNRKTLNEKFDNQLAVTSGDYLIGIALSKLVKIGNIDVISQFSDVIKNMCKGEIEQYFNRFKKIKLEKYIEKTSSKTASLFEGIMTSALIISQEQEKIKSAQEFAKNFGIAFQIRDDLKNAINSDKTKDSSDFVCGIYTAPYILDNDLNKGIEKTKELLNNYISYAKYCIKDLDENIYKDALCNLLELIKNV